MIFLVQQSVCQCLWLRNLSWLDKQVYPHCLIDTWLILSSKHSAVRVAKNEKKVPETIEYYNSTKFGVDTLDQMSRKYSVKAGARRWPLQVFFNILDLAAINAWIIYKECTGSNISRRDFLLRLAEELCGHRALQTTTSDLSLTFATKLRASASKSASNEKIRSACQVRMCNNNKTSNTCAKCDKYVCGACEAIQPKICKKCYSA